jgi:uncharacterized membrane protein
LKRLAPWLLAGLLLAIGAYEGAILATPRALMWLVMRRLGAVGGVDQIVHAPRADEGQRRIVMPSSDLLYSYCVYDLALGPLHVHAEAPAGTYWSLSAFDARTDNYYAVNDRDPGAAGFDLVLVEEGADTAGLPATAATRVVRSPSRRGLLLFRTLVDRDERAAELDTARRRSYCERLQQHAATTLE